jgi:hypothetical protein
MAEQPATGIAILIFREAVLHDTAAIAELVTELGFHATAEDVGARLPILGERGEAPIRGR